MSKDPNEVLAALYCGEMTSTEFMAEYQRNPELHKAYHGDRAKMEKTNDIS